MNPKNTLRLLLAAFSCLALPTQAAPTISYLGDDTTNAATWRSTGVAKNATFDVDGDNAYGTAGYALIKTIGVTHGSALTTSNWVTDLPGFVTMTASSGKIWYHEIYPDFDNPTLPIAATVGDLTATPQGYDNPSVTFTLTSNQDFVLSVITTHDLVGPGTLTLTGPGGATASVTNTTTKLGMYFFDMKGFETGNTFTLTATASGTVVGKFAAVAFDAIPDGSGLADNFQLIITPNGLNYDFAWNSLDGKLYDLVSSPDLATPITTWPVWDGRLNVPSTPPTNTLTNVPGGGDKRFFAVIEKNAADVDLVAPALAQIWGSANTITLVFSEEMAAADATDPAHYSVVKDGGGAVAVTGASLGADGKTITLTLAAPLDIASSFAVAINNLTDLAGNPIAAAAVGNFQTWDDDPNGVQVFILAGQSNMVGHGKAENGYQDVQGAIGSLRHLAINDDLYPDVDYRRLLVDPANPATSAWKTRSDVKVWWRDSDIGTPRAIIKGDLKIGYSQSRNPTWYGPEFGFGWQVGDHFTDKPVLIIKCAWGGKSLNVDFRPPSAVARGGVLGPYYTGMIEYVRDVLSNLATEFPAAQNPEFAAVGYRYRIAGFGWHQGWNDRVDATASANYEANLVDLINDLRAEFGKPALPFSITTTGMAAGPAEAYPHASYTLVEKAQLAVADPSKPVFLDKVKTTDTRPFWRDASVSPSNFGYHWNHNGESQYLNGSAMGRQMLEMLAP